MKTEKTIARIAACMTAMTLTASLFAGCGNNASEPDASASQADEGYTNIVTTTAAESVNADDVFTSGAEVATEAETTTETEPVEEPVPEKAELLNSVWTQLNSAESFRMNCNVKGKVPSETSDMGMLIDQSFTYTVSGDVTHLESKYTNLDSNDPAVEYEEYQILNDSIVTTLTKHGDDWVDNTPKEMIRTNMMLKALNTAPLVGILANDANTATESLIRGNIYRNDNDDYVFDDIKMDKIVCYSDDFYKHMLAGFIRTPAVEDYLYNVCPGNDMHNSGCTLAYTFDKDYNLKSIVFDAIVNETNGYDVHCEITFDSWNTVPPIVPPFASKIETTEAAETESTDTAE